MCDITYPILVLKIKILILKMMTDKVVYFKEYIYPCIKLNGSILIKRVNFVYGEDFNHRSDR